MKDKGFTLIELIAVIVIMGMLLLIVFPATARLMRSNENKKYDTYYDAVQEQLELYARTRRDELGGIQGSGCVDDKELGKLKDYDYIKEYTEDKDVSCLSPSEFQPDELASLGIDASRDYVNIRIDNNKGNIKVQYSMICVRNRDDQDIMSLLYSRLIEKESTCDNYEPEITNSLLNAIKNQYSVDTPSGSTDSYLTGNPTNNYVWYSGKMWRIVSFNTSTRTIKLVTDDVVSVVNYNNELDNNYSDSNIFIWLKNVFFPTLRNPDKYLENVYWNYSSVAANVSTPITSGESVEYQVGMLNNFEYNKGAGFLNKSNNFWLLSTKTSGSDHKQAWYVNETGTVVNDNVDSFYGVRPAIVLKPNIKYIYGGNGDYNNPYRLIGDNSANVGAYLNSRIPGEYVSVNNLIYRISSVDARYTKLIALNTISLDASVLATLDHITSAEYNAGGNVLLFHYFDKEYTDNSYIGEYLSNWVSPIEDLLIEGDFCRKQITKNDPQTADCPQDKILRTKIAIPKLGDLYVVNSNKEYWTLTNASENRVNVIDTNCTVKDKLVGEGSLTDNTSTTLANMSAILPVIIVNNEATIAGGNGTFNIPYTLQLE